MKTEKSTKSDAYKVERLARYIVESVRFCPIPENVNVPECEGWGDCDHVCVKCVVKHADIIGEYDD